MRIEQLAPHHWQRLRDLRLAALRDAPAAFGSTMKQAIARKPEEWRKEVLSLPTFVAIVDDQDAGMVRAATDEADLDNAYLISMWVAPEYRRHGIAEQLITRVTLWARQSGYKQLLLDVADDNLPAVTLYEKQGFKPTGVTGTLPAPRTHIREHQRVLQL